MEENSSPADSEAQSPAETARHERTLERRLFLVTLILAIVIGWAGLFLFYRPNEERWFIDKPTAVPVAPESNVIAPSDPGAATP